MAADAKIDVDNQTKWTKGFLHGNYSLPPLGHDPTFQPASKLWKYDLINHEGEYYNNSQVHVHHTLAGHQTSALRPIQSTLHSDAHVLTSSVLRIHGFVSKFCKFSNAPFTGGHIPVLMCCAVIACCCASLSISHSTCLAFDVPPVASQSSCISESYAI